MKISPVKNFANPLKQQKQYDWKEQDHHWVVMQTRFPISLKQKMHGPRCAATGTKQAGPLVKLARWNKAVLRRMAVGKCSQIKTDHCQNQNRLCQGM